METSGSSLSSEEQQNIPQPRKNSNQQKRQAPKPPIVEEEPSPSSVNQTPNLQQPKGPTVNLQENNGAVPEKAEEKKEPVADKSSPSSVEPMTDQVVLISHPKVDAQADATKNAASVEAVKITENGNKTSNENCQVTISSNHSTIISTNEALEEDKSNISIVTIENGKDISIKSSDFNRIKAPDLENVSYASSDSTRPTSASSSGKKGAKPEKIVLNNEYVPQSEKETPPPLGEQTEKSLSRTSSNNDQNIKTTIKVNLNLVSESDNKHGSKAATPENSKLLTRIDQVNSRNYERKREVANNQANSAVGNGPDNEIANNGINASSDQSVILRKKREMVCGNG